MTKSSKMFILFSLLLMKISALEISADNDVHCTPEAIQTATGIVSGCCKANQKYNALTFSCQDCIDGYSNCVPNTYPTCYVDIRKSPCKLSTPSPEVIHEVTLETLNTTDNHYVPTSTEESPVKDNNTFDKHEGESDVTASPEEKKGAERASPDETEISRGPPPEKEIEHVKVQIQNETKERDLEDTEGGGDCEDEKETPRSKNEEESKCEHTPAEPLYFVWGFLAGAVAILIPELAWFVLWRYNSLPDCFVPKMLRPLQQAQGDNSTYLDSLDALLKD